MTSPNIFHSHGFDYNFPIKLNQGTQIPQLAFPIRAYIIVSDI